MLVGVPLEKRLPSYIATVRGAGVVVELTDKEKRAMNKKIKDELLQKISPFKFSLRNGTLERNPF